MRLGRVCGLYAYAGVGRSVCKREERREGRKVPVTWTPVFMYIGRNT